MEGGKEDNKNKYNNSDLLTTDSCNKADKENGETTVGETCKSEPDTSNTTCSRQRHANPDKIENTAECFDVGINKEQGNIKLESETDKSSVKEEQGDSFECIDHKDCQATENENQAENPKTQSTNRTGLGNAGGQTSDSLHPENLYESVFDNKQGPFNSYHNIASAKRQLEDRRKMADGNLPKAFGRGRISKGRGDVTVSRRPLIGQSISAQQGKDQRRRHYEELDSEQEEKNTKPRHGANSSRTSSTYSSEKLKTGGKRKLGGHEDEIFGATTTSKVDGTGQNVPGSPDANQSHHSSENSDEGHQKDDSKSTVSSASATADIKNSFDDSKDNSLEADINSEDKFGSEHGPVRVNEIEQTVNSSLVRNYAGTNKQKEIIAHANPEKINTEDEVTVPEAESLELMPKKMTNQNAPMQGYKDEQGISCDSLTESKERVADKEEVVESNKTSNMDVRNKYKNKKNGNSSQSDTSSEDQNLRKDPSSEFKGEINPNIPQIKNPANNTINSEEGRQQESISKNTIHSPNSNNLDDDGTRSVTLNKNNKLTQTEQNLKEELLNISDYFECQKCSENNLTISNLQTHIVDLKKEISKNDMDIKQLEQENSEKDKIIKELQKKTSEIEETNKNFKESDEECKSAIESLLKDLSIKKSSERGGLWNFLTGNKSKVDKDGTINAINQIKSHIQKQDAKITEQQTETANKNIVLNTYVEELQKRNIQYKNLEKTFESKRKEQIKILEGRDTEIKVLTKERNMKEKYYTKKFIKLSEENDDLKTQLKDCKVDFNDALKDLKEKDKKVAEFNSVFNTQIVTITKLQDEKWKLEHKNATLENFLRQANISLQTFISKNSTLESHLDQACNKIKKFEEELKTLRNAVKKEESNLKPQKEALQIYLNRISNTIQIVCKPVSQETNARQTEETFINNALERILKIQQDVNNYEDQIREFEGNRQSKTYLHLKEMLLRAAVQLDGVESERKKRILTSRKEAIARVKDLLGKLEEKVQY